MKNYKLVNGTSYNEATPDTLINVLERARLNRTRLKVYFGNTETGKNWVQEYDILGYIGRSGGSIKIPLLVYNDRSLGGGGLLDHCILKVKESKGNRVLYQHSKYQAPAFEKRESTYKGFEIGLYVDGELYANCPDEKEANRIIKKLS